MIDCETVEANGKLPKRLLVTERTGDDQAVSFSQFVVRGEQEIVLVETLVLGHRGQPAERHTDADALREPVRKALMAQGYGIIASPAEASETSRSPERAHLRPERIGKLRVAREVPVRLPDEILNHALSRYYAAEAVGHDPHLDDYLFDYVSFRGDWRTGEGKPVDPDADSLRPDAEWCPVCGTPISAVSTIGPHTHRIHPCGHPVSEVGR